MSVKGYEAAQLIFGQVTRRRDGEWESQVANHRLWGFRSMQLYETASGSVIAVAALSTSCVRLVHPLPKVANPGSWR